MWRGTLTSGSFLERQRPAKCCTSSLSGSHLVTLGICISDLSTLGICNTHMHVCASDAVFLLKSHEKLQVVIFTLPVRPVTTEKASRAFPKSLNYQLVEVQSIGPRIIRFQNPRLLYLI